MYTAHYIEVLSQPISCITIHYNVPISVVVDVVGISEASPIVVLNRIKIIIYVTKMSKNFFLNAITDTNK